MSVDYAVISIGTLSHNRLWGEKAAVRTAHATTTLVVSGDRRILVDPSLPAPALAARFFERKGKPLSWITDVFCTSLRPVHRRAVEALPNARWWASAEEIETYSGYLDLLAGSAQRLSTDEAGGIEADRALIRKFSPAPDQFGPQVSLYPLAGPSPGSAGLLLTPASLTIVIAGDAALTVEHVLSGQVWEGCADANAAMESLEDMVQLADVIVPGHDNVMLTPRHWL
jgi:glyoxylase-like metal-dependent hydrolase (beta-lactamase superfamily II)